MSLENEDLSSDYEISGVAEEQSKVLYSREFLLSFSELEICKKLPSGFDPSILSEFEDAFHGTQERQRAPVGFQLQGYKRSEYNSSPPTRGDSGTYARSSYGRWDTRSSGPSDQDSDSHSDPGRNHVNPSRRPWPSSEHDGLLGSGSFSKPGYGSGNSSLKSRVIDDNQNNQSNVPYHPPRPYKAVPYPRRETKDSYNDETFGSSGGASEDKVEEERQRRASFELSRKEQHRVLQEKQKLNEMQKANAGSGISEIFEDMNEKRDLGGSYVSHESATGAIPVNDSIRSSQTATSRPLVPPGFANAIGEKSLKPSVHTNKIEIAKSKPEELPLHSQLRSCMAYNSLEIQPSQEHSFGDNRLEDRSSHTVLMDKGTKIGSALSFGISDPNLTVGDNFFRTSSVSETHDSFDGPEVIPIVSGSEARGEFNKSQTPSILEKFFTSSSTSPAEQSDGKPDDTWNPISVHSSKITPWFLEEERKPGEDLICGMPNDLLPLIVGGDKGICQPSGEKYMFPPGNSRKSSEFASDLMFGLSSKSNDISNHQYESRKTEAIPLVLLKDSNRQYAIRVQ
ncbi:hypothetical protein Leryth_004777 [Lithospermum erythrorhizon]|nr:hypothetical protein Leryth_004777 [Lithospermum erythrorhizon]